MVQRVANRPAIGPDRRTLIARADSLEAQASHTLRSAKVVIASIPTIAAGEAEASLPPEVLISSSDWLRLRRADVDRPCEGLRAAALTRRLWHFYGGFALHRGIRTWNVGLARKFAVADLRFAGDWLVDYSAAFLREFRDAWGADREEATRRLFDRAEGYVGLCSAPPAVSVRLALAAVAGRPAI